METETETNFIPSVPEQMKMDMRAFFRDIERGARRFLYLHDKLAKEDPHLNPYKMTRDAWWRAFMEYAIKNETR